MQCLSNICSRQLAQGWPARGKKFYSEQTLPTLLSQLLQLAHAFTSESQTQSAEWLFCVPVCWIAYASTHLYCLSFRPFRFPLLRRKSRSTLRKTNSSNQYISSNHKRSFKSFFARRSKCKFWNSHATIHITMNYFFKQTSHATTSSDSERIPSRSDYFPVKTNFVLKWYFKRISV